MEAQDLDWQNIVTPVKVDVLAKLLSDSNYDVRKSAHLVKGFSEGFSIGYEGPVNRCDEANNLPLRVGSLTDLWNKVMKKVQEHRYAGPFKSPPTNQYIQSPIGLVPKSGGKTRLIFHLSYDFGPNEDQKLVNHHTPDHLCSVKYNDLDCAVRQCLDLLNRSGCNNLVFSKTDCSHAFRILPIRIQHRKFLMMKAKHPETGEWWYFIEKCLPFGSSISCVQFQAFSDALRHITEWKLRLTVCIMVPPTLTNYLDDFLFIALSELLCNDMMTRFLEICELIGCPIAADKTEWGSVLMVFLGILLNGKTLTLSLPLDKRSKAINLLNYAIEKKKVTIHFVQKLTGTLNFLNRAIVPGRAFTKSMYKKLTLKDSKGNKLKKHHHVYLNKSFIQDCRVWLQFLSHADDTRLCRPLVDFDDKAGARILSFTSDASRNGKLGMGAVFNHRWLMMQWPVGFVDKYDPSIEFLELYAVVVALLRWRRDKDLHNGRITIWYIWYIC